MADHVTITANSSTERDPMSGRFLPGNSGAGGGRPRGSRNRLGQQFVDDLCLDWQAHGRAVITAVRNSDPSAYLKVVAQLLPDQIELGAAGDFSHLQTADEVIEAMIAESGDDLQGFLSVLDQVRDRVLLLLSDQARPALPAPR
jgi:hypothetical protein